MEKPEKFEVGQTVKCLFDGVLYAPERIQASLVKGNTYIVQDVMTCRCGRVKLDVGIFSPTGSFCQCQEEQSGQIHWVAASRFAHVPKPKRTVTKDANYCRDHWKGAFGKPFDCAEDEIRATGYATFIFPADATNIKVTYQVEE